MRSIEPTALDTNFFFRVLDTIHVGRRWVEMYIDNIQQISSLSKGNLTYYEPVSLVTDTDSPTPKTYL